MPGKCCCSYSDHSLKKERERKTDRSTRDLSFSVYLLLFPSCLEKNGWLNKYSIEFPYSKGNRTNIPLHSYAKVSLFVNVFMTHPGNNVFNVHNIVYTWALISEQ